MKKILPALFIMLIFTVSLVVQMTIHGPKTRAEKSTPTTSKYSVFENQFSKLKLTTSKGLKINLVDRKEPIIIINFWASWCRPCLSEFKSLNKLISELGRDVFVIGINNDTENAKKAITKTEKRYKLKFQSVRDEEGDMASLFNITSIPASVIYFKGKVIRYENGEFDFSDEDFISELKSYLKK